MEKSGPFLQRCLTISCELEGMISSKQEVKSQCPVRDVCEVRKTLSRVLCPRTGPGKLEDVRGETVECYQKPIPCQHIRAQDVGGLESVRGVERRPDLGYLVEAHFLAQWKNRQSILTDTLTENVAVVISLICIFPVDVKTSLYR